jgi:hypothetical protein
MQRQVDAPAPDQHGCIDQTEEGGGAKGGPPSYEEAGYHGGDDDGAEGGFEGVVLPVDGPAAEDHGDAHGE